MADRHAVIMIRRVDEHPFVTLNPKTARKAKYQRKPKWYYIGSVSVGPDLDVGREKWLAEHGPGYSAGEAGRDRRELIRKLWRLAKANGATSYEVI
jgi:hypothetical protein